MTRLRDALTASGSVGRDLLAVDWKSTPLGELETWPGSLQNAVRILVTSRFSMWMAWGPELTFFCNDAYRRDTLGKKYPWALGKPASTVWSEIWPDIGPRIDHVMTTGEATWDERLLLFLERSGFVEETYHTFSYSPLADDSGDIAGMLCVVKEDTEEVVAARRMATLRDLGSRSTGDLTEAETIATACQHLAANSKSLPFTAVYLFDEDGRSATRAGATGFTGEHAAAPLVIAVDDEEAPWPAAELFHGGSVLVEDLGRRFTDLPLGAWDASPSRALVVPLAQPTQPSPYGFLVAGLNPFRPVDEGFRSFVALVAGQIAAAVTDARTYEFERQRAESLARIDQAKTDFFTNVSHEFRTPLTLLLGPVDDALADPADPLSPVQRRRLQVVHRNGQRLFKLVNSLLDFSRLESGKVTSRFEALDLARATSELATLFQSAVERAGLRLVVDCRTLPEPVYVDPDQWAKIVLNLVSNALKFTFEGEITVSLRAEDGEAVLTVSDTGAGIPEHEMEHLFERFHRVHGARSRTHEGSGIGLALVAELAGLHGGGVSAESQLGQGSTFTVRVPFGTEHLPPDHVVPKGQSIPAERQAGGFVAEALRWLEEDRPAAEQADLTTSVVRDRQRATVLVVDDNSDMREYVAELLSSEYDVHTASDGIEALEKLSEVRADLVLTDVMMPNLDGFGLLEKMRADPATTSTPVIMLSARAGEEGTIEGLEAGADDYLVKPFSARELRARVRANIELDKQRQVRSALERSQALLDQAERLAGVGSWEVDLETGQIQASDEYFRLMERTPQDLDGLGYPAVIDELIHPEDRARVRASLDSAADEGVVTHESRVVLPSGRHRLFSVWAEIVRDESGAPKTLRGSVQDITSQRESELALAAAAGREEAAAREHTIADELQRSLLPERSFDLEHLEVATYYVSGVEGTQVGGDWYDIVELGAGRTAFVVGDVMGRGVKAAAIMGQLRTAVRAFAHLDLPPTEILEHLDGMVQNLQGDQIVTCVYAVFDSTDQTLRFANAGHLPPLLTDADGELKFLTASGPPLGAGYFGLPTESVQLSLGSTVTFYTDGLVEHRGRDLEVGIEALAEQLREHAATPLSEIPEILAGALLPRVPDDDVAILAARVNAQPFEAAATHRLRGGAEMVAEARGLATEHLREWRVPEGAVEEVVLMVSELVTNALVHGRPPFDLRLRRSAREVFVEVQDRAPYRPRRQRPTETDEHGRGLQIVSVLADGWGSRASGNGKCVWFTTALEEPAGQAR